MATYYWVGGAGTWDASSTTNWASSSGGSGGAGVPTSADDVIFDTNSGTGTINGTSGTGQCKNFTVTATQTISFASSNSYVNVYGNLELPATGSFNTTYLNIRFNATTTGKTILCNSKALRGSSFNGSGGEWTLLSDASLGPVTFTTGSLITNNYNITASSFFISGTSARSLTLGSSTIATGTWDAATTTNFTLNVGTSTFNLAGYVTFNGGGLTYNNVSISQDARYVAVVTGSNTFNNLTISQGYASFSDNQTITGTLSVTGSGVGVGSRTGLITNTAGVQRTIIANNVSLTNADFYGIVGAGLAVWSGTSLGDASLNSNITFTAPKTLYWSLATGGAWNSAAWATSSGGTPSTSNYPLPQDTVIIDNAGLNTAASINLAITQYFILPALDMSSRTNAMTFSWNKNTNSYAPVQACGSITLGSGVTNSGTNLMTFLGSTALTSAGKTWTAPITVATGATLTNADAFTSSSSLTNNGTLTLGANATFTTCTLGAASTTNFSTNKITLTGNAATIFTGNATQTVTGTPVIDCTYSSSVGIRTLSPSTPTEGNTISFNITAGTDTILPSDNSRFRNLNFTGFSGSLAPANMSFYGDLTFSSGMGFSAGTATLTFAATSGTKTITTNGKTLDFSLTFNGVGGTWQLADNLTQGSTRTTTLTNGTLDLNGKTYTCGYFFTDTGTKNLTFNGGTLICAASSSQAFYNIEPFNFTTTAGTGIGKISMTGATDKTFFGGGSTYNCTLENAGAGALTITGSNTFTTISNSVQPTSFVFTGGTTTTVTNFNVSGTSGNLVTIGSTNTVSHTLSKSSGTVSVQYCSISRSTATGGALWQAYTTNGNVNGGNNSGWLFSDFTANGLFFGSNF